MNLLHKNRSEENVGLTYFTDFQARTVEAVAERIIPGDGSDAGAKDAGVIYYIDRSITGFSIQLQPIYRLGLLELEKYCEKHYAAQFVDLTPDVQDEIIRHWLGPEIPDRTQPEFQDHKDSNRPHSYPTDLSPASSPESEESELNEALLERLFKVIREHTVEGFFCDPAYGGNRDAVGWKLVGFPGAQWGYTAEQMEAGYDSRKIVIKTLSDLRKELGSHDNAKYNSNERS